MCVAALPPAICWQLESPPQLPRTGHKQHTLGTRKPQEAMMVGRAQGIGAKSKLTTLECSSRRGRTDHLFPPLLGPTESPKLTQESHSQRWDLNSGPPTPRPHCTCCSRGSELTRATVQYPITKGVTGHHHLTDGNPGLRERLAWEAESGPDPWTPSSVVLGEGPFFCL